MIDKTILPDFARADRRYRRYRRMLTDVNWRAFVAANANGRTGATTLLGVLRTIWRWQCLVANGANPTVGEIADYIGLTKPTVSRAIAFAAQASLLLVQTRYLRGRRIDRFTIVWGEIAAAARKYPHVKD